MRNRQTMQTMEELVAAEKAERLAELDEMIAETLLDETTAEKQAVAIVKAHATPYSEQYGGRENAGSVKTWARLKRAADFARLVREALEKRKAAL